MSEPRSSPSFASAVVATDQIVVSKVLYDELLAALRAMKDAVEDLIADPAGAVTHLHARALGSAVGRARTLLAKAPK